MRTVATAVGVRGAVENVLLVTGILVELLCCLGFVLMKDAFDRLHYLSAASTLGPVAIAGAVAVREGGSSLAVKAILVAVVLFATGPVLTHAIGRAAHLRRHGAGAGAREDSRS